MTTDTETIPAAVTPPPASHRKHHPCSPSTLQTREGSPCYTPRGGTSEAAERGTLQHDAADQETIPDELDDTEAEAVVKVLEMSDKYIHSGDHEPNPEVHREAKWPIDDVQIADSDGDLWTGTTAGFADLVIVSPGRGFADILDWKFGKNAVESADNNTQGIAYGLGVVHVYRKRGIRIRKFRVTFFSPHINDFTSHTFEEEQFPALYLRIKTIVTRAVARQKAIAKTPGDLKLYTPSVPGCMFCGRLGTCEAVARFALSVSEKYKPLGVDPNDVNYYDLTSPEKARQALGASDTLSAWSKEVRQRLTQYAIAHPDWTPEGYQLTTTFPRKVVDAGLVEQIATEQFGVPPQVVREATKLPLTPLEKYIKSQAARGQKDSRVAEFGAALDEAGATKKSLTPTVSLRILSRRNVDKED